jgi:hypothetical protein
MPPTKSHALKMASVRVNTITISRPATHQIGALTREIVVQPQRASVFSGRYSEDLYPDELVVGFR